MSRTHRIFLPAVLGLCCWTASSEAALITGDGALGHFTGSLNYSFTNATSATLTVQLTNTSPVAQGGYLTAFVFNNPGNLITGVTMTSTDADFGLLGGPTFNNSIVGGPHGEFDIGASTGGNYEGGGPPQNGIGVNASATFTFNLTGTLLNTLTAESFLNTLSQGTGAGQGYQAFVARFRGFELDENDTRSDSDKVPINTTHHTPEPTSLTLGGLGLLGLLGYRWRRQRR